MSKHTPGPWRIDETAHHDCGYGRSSNAIVGKNGEPVVLFDPSGGEYAEALDPRSADARLIAAAPELLEALQILAEHDFGTTGWTPLLESAAIKGRAAIRKATGE
jgi:hypothetical protein